jgi:hypothetical protein
VLEIPVPGRTSKTYLHSSLCLSRTGNWQWEDHRPPSGVCKGTSGGQAVLISGYSDGKSKFSMVSALHCTPILYSYYGRHERNARSI